MRSRRDADRRGSPDIQELRLEGSVPVEHLYSSVPGVGDEHITLRIDRDAVRDVELARPAPSGAPGLDELAVLVELGDPGVAEAIRHVNVTSRVPGDVGGPLKQIALRPRTVGISASATSRWTFGSRAAPSSATGFRRRCRRCDRQSRYALRLVLPAQQHLNPPVLVELDYHARHLIHNPDVVLRIDPDLLSDHETVRILPDLAYELPGLIELKQARASMRERAGRSNGNRRVPHARVDENVPLGVSGDAGHFAWMNVIRKFQRIGAGIESD